MNMLKRITRKEAEALGYTVDTHGYPWVAYTGSRFDPTNRHEVYTDLEAELLGLQAPPETQQYNDLTLGEITAMVQPYKDALQSGNGSGFAYVRVTDDILKVVGKTFLLHSYRLKHIETVTNDAGGPELTFAFHRNFGEQAGKPFIARIRLTVSADRVAMHAEVLRPVGSTFELYNPAAQYYLEPDVAAIPLLELVNDVIEQSLHRISDVAGPEGIPTVFGLPAFA
jgi:hypothetical protein